MLALAVLLLVGEGIYTSSRDYLPAESAPRFPPAYGESAGQRVRLAILGDSTAVGLGAGAASATVGGGIAQIVARQDRRYVPVLPLAVSGARARDLSSQVDAVLAQGGAELAVVLVGANDATHATRLSSVRGDVEQAVRRLVAAGVRVVVGTCPDMGAARALPQPLRLIVAARGRAVADAEREGIDAAGGTAVDLGRLTGPAFRADPATLSADLFHPSDRGYQLWTEALAPAVLAAVPASS